MSLYLQSLYESMVRQFNTTTNDERFKDDFVDATNLCLDELSNSAKMATAMEHIASNEDYVDDLDEEHSYILNAGLIFHLVNMGQKHVRGDLAYAAALGQWDEAKGDWMVIQQQSDQSDVDDFNQPENDIVGLGHIDDD